MSGFEIHRQSSWYSPWSRLELKEVLPQIMDFFGFSEYFLELRLCGDREISGLNREFLGLPGPTNVLSFPNQESSGQGKELSGQICISLPAVYREAILYGQQARIHMLRLLLHGILHLADHPHGEEMQGLTEQGLQLFGLQNH